MPAPNKNDKSRSRTPRKRQEDDPLLGDLNATATTTASTPQMSSPEVSSSWFPASLSKSFARTTPATAATTPASEMDTSISSQHQRSTPLVSWAQEEEEDNSFRAISPLQTSVTVEENTLSETSCSSATGASDSFYGGALDTSTSSPPRHHSRESSTSSPPLPLRTGGRTLFPDSPGSDVDYVLRGQSRSDSNCRVRHSTGNLPPVAVPEPVPARRTESYPVVSPIKQLRAEFPGEKLFVSSSQHDSSSTGGRRLLRSRRSFNNGSEHTSTTTSSRRSRSRRGSSVRLPEEGSFSSSEEHSSSTPASELEGSASSRRMRRHSRRHRRKVKDYNKSKSHYLMKSFLMRMSSTRSFLWVWMTIGIMSVTLMVLSGRTMSGGDEPPKVSILFRQMEESDSFLAASLPFSRKAAAGAAGNRPLSGLRGNLLHEVTSLKKQGGGAAAGSGSGRVFQKQRQQEPYRGSKTKKHYKQPLAKSEKHYYQKEPLPKSGKHHRHHGKESDGTSLKNHKHARDHRHHHDAKKTVEERRYDRPERKKVAVPPPEPKSQKASSSLKRSSSVKASSVKSADHEPVHSPQPVEYRRGGAFQLPPGKLAVEKSRDFALQDPRFYSTIPPSAIDNSDSKVEGNYRRVALLDSSGFRSTPKHRRIQLYPADFTDNTQLYSILDSSDERVWSTMERREPLSNGECVPMQEWQTTFHPSCNGMHELDLSHLGEENGDNFQLFGTKGFWRNAWRYDSLGGHKSLETRDTIVLKTLKINHRFEEKHFEHDRIDAVAMERLTASPHVINIFGYCGHSVMTEFADGKRVGDLADKSAKTPLARLRIAADIASGLADVHGIDGDSDGNSTFVHLDINPANVVSVNGTLKLNDFNIGILRRWNTTSNKPCGFPAQYPNPQWRSPEENRKEQHLTEKVDVFSMGHIFFRLICQHEPWNKMEPGGRPPKEVVNEKVVNGVLPFIPDHVKTTKDPEVIAIREAMLKCYTYNPEDRPSAREIANHLKRALERLRRKSTTKLS